MTNHYKNEKFVYVTVLGNDEFSNVIIRGGRLITQTSVELGFIVDNDGKNYPSEGVNQCKTCDVATRLNVTFFAAF